VLEFSQPRNPIVRALNTVYTGRVMPWTATLLARDRSGAYRYLPKSVETFLSPAQFTELLQSPAGGKFASVTVRPLTFGICTAYLARV
jgi:demethylmenaquinone methyltransferase/2-methoxy-6-polyprenyl-1,4-benzoquinol methylase